MDKNETLLASLIRRVFFVCKIFQQHFIIRPCCYFSVDFKL